jgi:quinoprotein glucose dehydrogenase
MHYWKVPASARLFFVLILLHSCQTPAKKYDSWSKYKGSDECLNYSSLRQVDTSNVKKLQVAWTYSTGDADTANFSQIQCNPIVMNGILYGTSARLKLFALEAATGKPVWEFNPFDSLGKDKKSFFILNNSRGVAWWSDGNKDERIYYTAGSDLYAVNARTGKPVETFGNRGKIDLHEGLGRDAAKLFITATSPPAIFEDILITGSRVDEGPEAAPGHIRAYDVRTGKQRWIFHTIPQPGEEGYSSWDQPDAWKYIGGANAWSGFSLDTKRGIVFAGTGSASYDWYGGQRAGDNLFANSVLALDARTGKRIWHYQYIHHDVWDRDFSSPPVLVTIQKDGKKTDAAAVTTKTGYVLLFDRETGQPLYDIEERPVPTQSDLLGEKLSPTQPYPVFPAPFMRQQFTEKDINPLLPDTSYQEIKRRLATYKTDHVFNPPSLQGTVMFPGLDGGSEWGGPSYDPETGMLYINSNEMAWLITAVPLKKKEAVQETYEQAGARLYQAHCMSCHGANKKGSGNVPSIVDMKKKYTSLSFDTLLRSGRRMMPAFKQLGDEERKAIASFVLRQKQEGKKKFAFDEDTTNSSHLKSPYTITGYHKFLTSDGLPAISPPWGTLNALNLHTGEYVWKKTLGHDPRFPAARIPTGTENYGASVVTAGGLLFIAATSDGKFRAFNKYDGQLLWEADLPSPAFATPAVYEHNGRQYIVIACGGGKNNTRSGDSYVAFALPQGN